VVLGKRGDGLLSFVNTVGVR